MAFNKEYLTTAIYLFLVIGAAISVFGVLVAYLIAKGKIKVRKEKYARK